jgi:crossover junction endodeoxyribonuclease RuvC
MPDAEPLRVLGIDPGLRVAGYGCISYDRIDPRPMLIEAGAIKLDTTQSVSHRLYQLWTDLNEVISDVSPDVVAVETVFSHARQVSTAITMGHARGVILLAIEENKLPLVELAPAEIKKSVTGNGRATKTQIQHAIVTILKLKEVPEPPDIADALAIAVTGALRY